MENGKINKVELVRKDEEGYYLKIAEEQEVFFSNEEVLGDITPGSPIDVFIYKDRSRIASVQLPYVQVDEYAFLKVNAIGENGAYVDWGLENDLFVPTEEQMETLEAGNYYVIFVFEEEDTGRIRGSQRVEDFVFFDDIDVKAGDEVGLLPYRKSNLGVNVVVNNLYQGLVFNSDIHKEVHIGEELRGYVKKVREDGKIDILLEAPGYKESIRSNTDLLLEAIRSSDNFLPLSDKSDPAEINKRLGMSKKAFKRAAGHLYKNKMIEIQPDGLRLVASK